VVSVCSTTVSNTFCTVSHLVSWFPTGLSSSGRVLRYRSRPGSPGAGRTVVLGKHEGRGSLTGFRGLKLCRLKKVPHPGGLEVRKSHGLIGLLPLSPLLLSSLPSSVEMPLVETPSGCARTGCPVRCVTGRGRSCPSSVA